MRLFGRKSGTLKLSRSTSSKSLSSDEQQQQQEEHDQQQQQRNRISSTSSSTSSYSSSSRVGSEINLYQLGQDSSSSSTIFKFGVIQKEGGNVHSWRRRLFIVRTDGVHYFKTIPAGVDPGRTSPQDVASMLPKKPTGSITLHGSEVSACPEKENRKVQHCFQVSTPRRTYYMSCDTREDMHDWIRVIRETIDLVSRTTTSSTSTVVDQQQQQQQQQQDIQQRLSSALRKDPSFSLGGSPSSFHGSPMGSSVISHSSSFIGSPDVSHTPPSASHGASESGEPIPQRRKFSDGDLDRRQSMSATRRQFSNDLPPESMEYHRMSVTSEDNSHEYMDSHRRSTVGTEAEYYHDVMAAQRGREPFLSEQDEYEIAMCAAEIFLKRPEERTPEEQAYVIAMNQYTQLVKHHMHIVQKQMQIEEEEERRYAKLMRRKELERRQNAGESGGSGSGVSSADDAANGGDAAVADGQSKEGRDGDHNDGDDEEAVRIELSAEYGLASGTLIFAIPEAERTEAEQEYVNDIVAAYMEELKQSKKSRYQSIPVELQVDAAKKAYQLLVNAEHQDDDEGVAVDPATIEYTRRVKEIMREVTKLEHEHGVKARFDSLLTGTLMLAKPEDRLDIEDVKFRDTIMQTCADQDTQNKKKKKETEPVSR